jgi:hypothetical protein
MRIAIKAIRLILFLLPLGLLVLLALAGSATPALAQTQPPPPTQAPTPGGGGEPTPAPDPTPTPAPEPGGIQQIIYSLLFPAETISEALASVFTKAAEKEAESLSEQAGDWAVILGEVVQAPSDGYYESIAASSLPVAAALAPALFLLRLALYHWRRLVGEDDSALAVIGDWVAAGALAVAAGPFLDLLTSLGWWMTGAALGETAVLAQDFIEATTVLSVIQGIAKVSFFTGILVIGVGIGGILAMAGMLFAFAAAQAVLYVLAVVAPAVAVAGVLRQMRWMRSLWIKAVAVLALLPVVAGGIFKAGVALSSFFSGGGLLTILIRLLWLWGAVGFLLALAGILSRVTLSAGGEALGEATGAVKAIIGTAVLATAAVGTAGAAAGAAGAAGAGGAAASGAGGVGGGTGGGVGGAAAGGAAASGVSGGANSGGSILGELDQAQAHTRQAGTLSALGFHGPAQYVRSQAHLHELAARRMQLEERLARFGGGGSRADWGQDEFRSDSAEAGGGDGAGEQLVGYSRSVDARIQRAFPGSGQDFHAGLEAFSPHIESHGLDPQILAQSYPEDTARMVSAYLADPEAVGGADDPLLEAARRGGAKDFIEGIYMDSQPGPAASSWGVSGLEGDSLSSESSNHPTQSPS